MSPSGGTCRRIAGTRSSPAATPTSARLRNVIREGQASGDFVLNDATIAATFILTALNGIAAWYRPDGFLSPGQLGDLYADLAVRSLTEVHR